MSALLVALLGCATPPSAERPRGAGRSTLPKIASENIGGEDHCPAATTGGNRRISGEMDLVLDSWGNVTTTAADLFGYGVAAVGDVSGDGLDDLSVIVQGQSWGTDIGGIYLLPSTLPPGHSFADPVGIRFRDGGPNDYGYWGGPNFGTMRALPDVTGDGLPELVLGHKDARPYPGTGAVYIVASPLASPGTTLQIEDSWSHISPGSEAFQLGHALDVGDLDGDGTADLVVSAPDTYDDDGGIRGRGYVFLGPLQPGERTVDDADWQVRGGETLLPLSLGGPVGMGSQVLAVDLSADGVADLLFTSPGSYAPLQQVGEAYLWEGPNTADILATEAAATLKGEVIYDVLGIVATALGDTDGDGYAEFGLSSTGGSTGIGDAWIFNGLPDGTSTVGERARTRFVGLDAGDGAAVVAPAGDLDQDGFDDVAVGASAIGADVRGGMFVFYGPLPEGAYPITQCDDAVMYGLQYTAPIIAAGAGDLQGDGIPDLAVGAYLGNTVYLLSGGLLP